MNGIKSLAQQGRYGDTMLAHINPEEAGILKALGGSGTINPNTGLPEYFVKSAVKPFKKAFSKLDDVVLQPITGAVQDVVQAVDKATGPFGQMAAAYLGGPLAPLTAGLYGGLAGEDGFNFKRGLMSGALAYGAQNLAGGLEAAGGGPPPIPDPTTQIASELGANAATGAGSQAAMLADQAAAFGDAGISNIASSAGYASPMQLGIPGTDLAAGEIAKTGLTEPPASIMDKIGSNLSKVADSSTYKDIGSDIATKTAQIPERLGTLGKGAYNLATNQPGAMANFKSVASLQNTALPMYMGATGIAAIDEAEKIKKQQELELAEYNARVNRGVASATEAMRANPYDFAAGGEVDPRISPDLIKQMTMASKMPSMYEMYQMKDAPKVVGDKSMMQSNLGYDIPLDKDTMLSLLASGNLTRGSGLDIPAYGAGIKKKLKDGEFAGYAEKNDMTGEKRFGAKYTKNFALGGDVNSGMDSMADSGLGNLRAGLHLAKGGMPPRFLSGGGDGMSDSIKATINGDQPARLADGEFVIPADVVSHLGNGSSKAGAKQLYSMMDKVRSARTGTKKQGRQINPNKFLPA
jgi:hypothetical protein